MLDMIGPKERTKICLADLKGCRMTPIFFDTFFNLVSIFNHNLFLFGLCVHINQDRFTYEIFKNDLAFCYGVHLKI